MPMPKPGGKETEQDFVSRFMADAEMRKDYPDQDQRAAVAYKTFRGENDLDRVCAWCGKSIGTKPSPETGTTHGICPDCLKVAERDLVASSLPDHLTKTREERAIEARADYGSVSNMIPQDVNGAYCDEHGDVPWLSRTGMVHGSDVGVKCKKCSEPGTNWYILKSEFFSSKEKA